MWNSFEQMREHTEFILKNVVFIILVSFSRILNTQAANIPEVQHNQKIFDLTWKFEENKTIYWSGTQSFSYTRKVEGYVNGHWYSTKDFCTQEHGGTHFDAPYHFIENGWKVGDIPSEKLFAKGATIDLTNETLKLGSNTTLKPEHLKEWQNINGDFENGTVLLVKFGWSKYWPDRQKYLGLDTEGNKNFPALSKEAAEWIVNSGKFYGVGLDTASVDPGTTSPADMWVHRILASHQLYNLENVKLTHNLPAKGFSLVIAPMNLKEGTGAPVRIFALIK